MTELLNLFKTCCSIWMHSLKSRKALQRNLDRLESWAISNHVKFKTTYRTLQLGWDNPNYTYRFVDKSLESSPTERELGFGLMAS